MGAIQNFTLADFKAAVMAEVSNGNVQISSAEQADKSIQAYFHNLAVTDDGENPNEYETDFAGFKESVGNCVKNILTSFQVGVNQITRSFTSGANEKGVDQYDIEYEYTNGELTRAIFGYDDNNDGQITGNEIEFARLNQYENGQIVSKQVDQYENEQIVSAQLIEYANGKLIGGEYTIDSNNNTLLDGDDEAVYWKKSDK